MKYLTRKFALAAVVAVSVTVPTIASALIVVGPGYGRPMYTGYPNTYVSRVAIVPPRLVTMRTAAVVPGYEVVTTKHVIPYGYYNRPLLNPLGIGLFNRTWY